MDNLVSLNRMKAKMMQPSQEKKSLKAICGNVFRYILLSFYAVISLYPIIWLLLYSLKTNEEIFVTNVFGFPKTLRFINYVTAWSAFDVMTYFKNSVIVSVITVAITLFLSLMFSYATARMHWKLASAARIYLTFGMFIPVQIIIIPLVLIMRGLHMANSYWSLIIPYSAFQLSFSSIIFYGFLRTLPVELEEAAAIDGANVYSTFFRIILPMVKPAIATMVIFVFLYAWNDLFIALIMVSENALKTLPLGLASFQGQWSTNWGATGASLVIASIPTILIYLIFSENVEKALTVGSALK
jgi:ABC-type sugar transport system, permease component